LLTLFLIAAFFLNVP
jgi:hypothetical protein